MSSELSHTDGLIFFRGVTGQKILALASREFQIEPCLSLSAQIFKRARQHDYDFVPDIGSLGAKCGISCRLAGLNFADNQPASRKIFRRIRVAHEVKNFIGRRVERGGQCGRPFFIGAQIIFVTRPEKPIELTFDGVQPFFVFAAVDKGFLAFHLNGDIFANGAQNFFVVVVGNFHAAQ